MPKKLPESGMIKELAELLEATQLSEIEVETAEGMRIRVARQFAAAPPVQAAAPEPPPPPPTETATKPAATPENQTAVKSPMVGTAYLSPEPDAKAFVNVGDSVTEGQTLLIIEAMKTMNPIPAPCAGKVVEIIVDNEQPVEFDEILVILE